MSGTKENSLGCEMNLMKEKRQPSDTRRHLVDLNVLEQQCPNTAEKEQQDLLREETLVLEEELKRLLDILDESLVAEELDMALTIALRHAALTERVAAARTTVEERTAVRLEREGQLKAVLNELALVDHEREARSDLFTTEVAASEPKGLATVLLERTHKRLADASAEKSSRVDRASFLTQRIAMLWKELGMPDSPTRRAQYKAHRVDLFGEKDDEQEEEEENEEEQEDNVVDEDTFDEYTIVATNAHLFEKEYGEGEEMITEAIRVVNGVADGTWTVRKKEFDVSSAAIAQQEAEFTRLEKEKERRKIMIAECLEYIRAMEKRLSLQPDECAVLPLHSVTTSALETYYREIARMSALQAKRLPQLLREARLRLQPLWQELHFSDAQTRECVAAWAPVVGEDQTTFT